MTDLATLPRALQLAISLVTKEHATAQKRELKRKRAAIVKKLRALDINNAEIGRLLGVSEQYVAREFPRQKVVKT